MGTMSKLRDNTGVVLWILVVAFGVVWVLQDSGAFDNMGTGAQDGNIIVVNGSPVTYEEYNRAVEGQIRQFEQQTDQAVTPQQRDQIQDRTYDMLVEQELLEQALDRLGISVTDEEVQEMVLGENPHPIIQTQFSDTTGQINRELLRNFVNNPESRDQLIQIENYLRQQRRQEKLSQLLAATIHIPEQEILDTYQRRNLEVDVEYVAVPYASVPDESIEVTESDLRDYYDEHRDDYRQERSYTLNYVSVSKAPTSQDTTEIVSELESLRNDFENADNDSLFLAQNASERPYSSSYSTPDDLDPAIADAVFQNGAQPGEVVGPVFSSEHAHLVKVQDFRPAGEEFVRARHILLRGDDEGELSERAQEVMSELEEGADFAALARLYSDDPSSLQGGDLGWFGRGQMVESFEEAAFNASIGEVVGPVETQFGLHFVEVTARTDQEAQIADYAMALRSSVATLNEIEQRLGDVAYYASESGDFESEVQEQGLELQQVQIEADQTNIPGLGSSRTISRFLESASEGDISDPIELDDQFVVLNVEEIQPEGYRSFEQVESQIRPRVEREKKMEVLREQMEQVLEEGGSLEDLAQRLDTEVRTQEGLTHETRSVPVLGRDDTFIGTAMGLSEGETSRVITGENAAFVLQTTELHEPAPITESERERLRNELQQQRLMELQQQWLADLREEADIDDRRADYER